MFGRWWIADLWAQPHGPVIVVSWLVWVIASIVLHELAHGWAALSRGDPTPRASGHMTWNPLVHMGHMSLVMLALFGIAWGAMPIDPTRMRGRWAEIITLAAGPAMNIALALAALVLGILWIALAGNAPEPLRGNAFIFLFCGAKLNIVLALFNLIPIVPLDGGRIAADLSPTYRRIVTGENGQWVALGAFLLLFAFAGQYLFFVGDVGTILGMILPGQYLGAETGMGIPLDELPHV